MNDEFSSAINNISTILNLVQVLAVLFSVVSLGLVFAPLMHPVYRLLGPLGLKKRWFLKLLWAWRKDPNMFARGFIELALIRTGGEHNEKRRWIEIIKEFQILRRAADKGRITIEVDSSSTLNGSALSESLSRYFKYLSSPRRMKRFNILEGSVLSFLSIIRIKEGYLLPAVLISGLLCRYQDDWSKIIDNFILNSGAGSEGQRVLPDELYFTFAWLMWGPSCQLKESEGYYRLIEVGYGDENNSVHAVIENDEKGSALWNEINRGASSLGKYASVDCTLYDLKSYGALNMECFTQESGYFLRKIAKEDSPCYILKVESIDTHKTFRADNYYFTAYLWIIFEAVEEGCFTFNPYRTVAFFEHANIADYKNYSFLAECLIDKAFAHFKSIFQDPEYVDRKYRYCLSMNSDIEQRFKKRLESLELSDSKMFSCFSERIDMQPVYSASDVFRVMDEQLYKSFEKTDTIEVNARDLECMELLARFYTGIYCDAFRDDNERETLDNIIASLKKKREGKNNYHVILLLGENKEVLGGLICDYLNECASGVIEFIAVKKDARLRGMGRKLYRHAKGLLACDAKRAHKELKWIFAEIEKPGEDVSASFEFWASAGFLRAEFDYTQPALSPEKQPAKFWLIVKGDDERHKQLPAEYLKIFLKEYARYAMRIEKPDEDKTINEMICGIKDAVALERLRS